MLLTFYVFVYWSLANSGLIVNHTTSSYYFMEKMQKKCSIVFREKNICVDYVLFILNRSLQSYLVCLRKLSATCIHDNHVKQVLSRYSLTCHKNPWEETIGKYNSRSKHSFYFYIYWNFCPFFYALAALK